MNKTVATICTFVFVAATATACSGSSKSEKEWFAENCTTLTSSIKDDTSNAKAITQGPIAAPAALDESNLRIGLYTYDELTDGMKQEAEVKAGDTFCMEEVSPEKRKTIDAPKIDGDAHKDAYESVDFTLIRSPKYPDGIWVNQFFDDLTESYAVDGLDDKPCNNQWWIATDVANIEQARDSGNEIGTWELAKREKC